jgi:uncharacterized protein
VTATFEGRTLAPGAGSGPALVLDQRLSFWGGVDPGHGTIVDRHHPQAGTPLAGTVVLMPSGRGSSSSSTVLAEAIRRRTAPAAVVMLEPDVIVALGSVVAARLYGRRVPVVVVDLAAYRAVRSGDAVTVDARTGGATVTVGVPAAPRGAEVRPRGSRG